MLLHSALSNNQTCVGAVLPAAANYSTSLLRIHKPDTLTLIGANSEHRAKTIYC